MRQLRTGSNLLESIKRDWLSLPTPVSFKVCEVKGGQDGVLAKVPHSPTVFFLADKDHRTIVKPSASDDFPYVIFRNFVSDTFQFNAGGNPITACLFDIYQPSFES